MKLALAQINVTVGDLAGNADLIIRFARDADARGAEVAVFPELSLTGYPPRDLVEKTSFLERTEQQLHHVARETAALGCGLICGYVGRSTSQGGKQATNSAALIRGGSIIFRQDKMLLPTYDVFDEARYFLPAESQSVCAISGRKVALTICEDAWNDKEYWRRPLYRRDPVDELMRSGAEVLISINASPYAMDKRALRRQIFSSTARRHKVPVVYVNQVGGNDHLIFDGSSFVFDRDARLIAAAASFQEDLVLVDLNTGQGDQHENLPDENEAVYQALVLGTRDYLRKCGFRRVLLGLSGGIDSSLTAVIAVDAVGAENVTGVALPGPYSSDHSLRDARQLAAKLGIGFDVIPITQVYEEFIGVLNPLFAGLPPDTTEENLQSRLRGVALMALSNKWRALVLTTGNKSELAVGYCTLYGDMSGGLAVISDVPKTLVYELARLANRIHPGAIPEAVFRKPPSAELKPDQKDTDSLPEYDILDPILRLYVEELQAPEQIATELGAPLDLVRQVINMVDRNEYKRHQAAPGLKVTSKAFGMGRRFPIAQRYSE